jgi:hypothetical protein
MFELQMDMCRLDNYLQYMCREGKPKSAMVECIFEYSYDCEIVSWGEIVYCFMLL